MSSHVSMAKKEISENPSKMAVTAPTDPKARDADATRKMKLYGIIEAFRQGKYPSNKQISVTLDHVLKNSPIDQRKLSKDGNVLVEDFQDIIRTAKAMVEQKNKDELFQNFLHHTRQVDYSKGNLKDISTGANKDEADRDGQLASEHLRTLGKLIFTNSEARKLLKDLGILGRDVAADAAVKASELARPSEEQLRKVDETAPSNQWVGPDGEVRDHTQAAPDTGIAEKRRQAQEKKEEVKSEAKNQAQDVQQQAQPHVDNVANAADNGQARQGGAYADDRDRAAGAADAGRDQALQEKDAAKGKAKNKIDELKNKIPEEHRERAKEQQRKAKDYARDKFPQERRDRFIYRLKKVVVENQRHRDYQEAIEFFLDRAERYGQVGKEATGESGNKALNVRDDNHFRQAEDELRTLLERFANGESMQPIFDAINQLYKDARNDEELRQWWSKLDAYVRECLQTPGYIMKDQADREGRQLMDESKRFFDPQQGKYSAHKDDLFNSIERFFTAYADDELNTQLGHDVKKLTTDLLYDSDGKLTYKPELIHDIKSVILPALATNIGYIPIPRIEYTDNQVDLVIENLTLESQNLLPNIIEFEMRNYFKVSPYDQIHDSTKHSFWISFSQVQADLKDVAFYLKKKSGFPKLQDSGAVDVMLGGKGMSGKIHLESTGRKHHAFKIVDVKVKLDTLKLAVRSKHSTLINLFKPLVMGLMKKAIAKAIEEGIRSGLQQVDAQLADISERVDEADDADGKGKYQKARQAFTEKKEAAKREKDEKTPDGQFQITTTRDSRLIDWSAPNSIVDKQKEAQQAALTGEGWRSEAFTIVGAKGLSKAPESSSTDRHHDSSRSAAGTAADRHHDSSRSGAGTAAGVGAGAGAAGLAAAGAHHASSNTHGRTAQGLPTAPGSTPGTTQVGVPTATGDAPRSGAGLTGGNHSGLASSGHHDGLGSTGQHHSGLGSTGQHAGGLASGQHAGGLASSGHHDGLGSTGQHHSGLGSTGQHAGGLTSGQHASGLESTGQYADGLSTGNSAPGYSSSSPLANTTTTSTGAHNGPPPVLAPGHAAI